MEEKTIVFNGETYIRNPKSRYYFKYTTRNCERKHAVQLHRAVWEYYNGEIPKGYHIHHIDGNVDNNDITNLECISAREHLSEHGKKNWNNPEYYQKNIKSLDAIREKTKEWHASEEGKAWHREHAKASICKVFENKIRKKCEFCGKEFDGMPWTMYCGVVCQRKANYRRKHVLLADQRKKCVYCGKEYVPKQAKQRFCCAECKRKQYWREKTACL